MQKQIIVGFGEALWDILDSEKLPGGAPANFSYHCQQLNAEAKMVSAVGADDLGDEIIKYFNDKKLTTDYIQTVAGYPTGTVTVKIDSRGVPSYIIHEPVAWDYIGWDETLHLLAQSADAICFGTLSQRNVVSRATLQRLLSSASRDCLKVFDINLRQSYYNEPMLSASLASSDVVKMNQEEAIIVGSMFHWGNDIPTIVRQLFKKFNFQLIAITFGEEGSKLFTHNEESFMKAEAITIADTIGAGDSFTAALITGWLNHSPLKEIHELATTLSAYVCTQRGAMPSYEWDLISK